MKHLAFWKRSRRGDECPCSRKIPAPEPPPDTVITLVHGTWAPHAKWLRDDSPLCLGLRELRGGTLIRRFCWSGGNSHTARLQAADELKDHLRTLVRRFQDARQFIIAHSHAGNVALYALKDENLRRCVAGVITLSTPFLHLKARVLPKKLYWAVLAIVVFAATQMVWPVDEATLEVMGVSVLKALTGLLLTLPSGLSVAVLSAFGLWILLTFASVLAYRGSEFTPGSLLGLMQVRNLDEELSRFQLPPLGPRKLLVVLPLGDEASGGLVTAQFLSWVFASYLRFMERLASWFWAGFLRRYLPVFFLLALATMAGGVLLDFGTKEGNNLFDDVFEVLVLVLVWVFYLMYLVGRYLAPVILFSLSGALLLGLSLLLAAGIPYGRDAVFWPLFATTTASVSPPGLGTVVQASVASSDRLKHSQIYEDEQVIKKIAEWIGRRADS